MPCLQEGRTLLGHENCCVAGHWRTVAQQTSSQVGTMKPDGSVVLHRLNATEQAHARYAASQSSHVHSRMSLRTGGYCWSLGCIHQRSTRSQ